MQFLVMLMTCLRCATSLCSSTEWWILPLCCDRHAQCQTLHFLGSVIDMPVLACQGRRHPCRDAEAVLMVQVVFPDHCDSSVAVR